MKPVIFAVGTLLFAACAMLIFQLGQHPRGIFRSNRIPDEVFLDEFNKELALYAAQEGAKRRGAHFQLAVSMMDSRRREYGHNVTEKEFLNYFGGPDSVANWNGITIYRYDFDYSSHKDCDITLHFVEGKLNLVAYGGNGGQGKSAADTLPATAPATAESQ
jgi:hypothetical protein